MHSIYHLYKNLVIKRINFLKQKPLHEFPFDKNLLASESKGKFPDISIRLNHESNIFTGGELVEFKDSESYTVSSFNSTIPTGTKKIADVITGKSSIIKQQMQKAGNNINALPIREVFYLVRGKNRTKKTQKIVLVHGSFFETLSKEELISQSFLQVLEERIKQTDAVVSHELKRLLTSLFSQQKNFSKVRNVDKASVKLRFRIMTEIKAEGNILHSKKYPEILDNTLNFVLPCHNKEDEKLASQKMNIVFSKDELKQIKQFTIKHHLNGNFIVFQIRI